MDLTMFLAQIFGIYLIVEGIVFLTKKKMILQAMKEIGKSERMMWGIGSLEFFIGLVLVLSHNIWSGPASTIVVTVIAWLTMIEGASYALFPKSVMQKIIGFFHKDWYLLVSVVILAIGIYLAYVGFGIGV